MLVQGGTESTQDQEDALPIIQPRIPIQEGEENQVLCCQKKDLFHRKKEPYLNICPKIEGVEPLSKFPALLEEAGRLIQNVAGFRNMDWKPLPGCCWCSHS